MENQESKHDEPASAGQTKHLLLQLREIEAELHPENAADESATTLQANINRREFHRAHQLVSARCRHELIPAAIQLEACQLLNS